MVRPSRAWTESVGHVAVVSRPRARDSALRRPGVGRAWHASPLVRPRTSDNAATVCAESHRGPTRVTSAIATHRATRRADRERGLVRTWQEFIGSALPE